MIVEPVRVHRTLEHVGDHKNERGNRVVGIEVGGVKDVEYFVYSEDFQVFKKRTEPQVA